jgi:hypothetical protein
METCYHQHIDVTFYLQLDAQTYFLTGAQDSHLQRVTIPEAAYIQLRRKPPYDEQGNARNM